MMSWPYSPRIRIRPCAPWSPIRMGWLAALQLRRRTVREIRQVALSGVDDQHAGGPGGGQHFGQRRHHLLQQRDVVAQGFAESSGQQEVSLHVDHDEGGGARRPAGTARARHRRSRPVDRRSGWVCRTWCAPDGGEQGGRTSDRSARGQSAADGGCPGRRGTPASPPNAVMSMRVMVGRERGGVGDEADLGAAVGQVDPAQADRPEERGEDLPAGPRTARPRSPPRSRRRRSGPVTSTGTGVRAADPQQPVAAGRSSVSGQQLPPRSTRSALRGWPDR